jgi:glycosyltransferase involved in cell wall biosynthesis
MWHGALTQDRLVQFYRRAMALVVPSRDEGLGLVAVEAQLCETPVVAFDSGGLPDIIDHGVSGVLVKDFASGALGRAIEDLLDNPDHVQELGRAGRRAALATFAPDAVARRYATIYREAIAGPSTNRAAAATAPQHR